MLLLFFLVLVYFIGNPTGGMPNYRESHVQRGYMYLGLDKKKRALKFALIKRVGKL